MGTGFAFATDLAVDAATLWRHAGGVAGINAELAPLRLGVPAVHHGPEGLERLAPRVPGRDLIVAWVTLAGVLPLDRHAFGFECIEPGRGFQERSRTLWLSEWRHIRTLEPVPGGTRLTDQVWFEGRLPGLARLLAPVYRAVFRRRHAWLRRHFGVVAAAASVS